MSVFRNIATNYVGRAYSIAALYVFVPFYVKILGVEAYSIIAAYTILVTLSGLADVGLSATFAREAARSSDKKKLLDLLSTIERILFVMAALFALIVFAGAEVIAQRWLNTEGKIDEQTVIWSFRLMAFMIVPQLGMSLWSAGLIGLQKQVRANLIQSLFVTFRSGVVVLPILLRPDLTLFFAWQLVATVAFALITRASLLKAMGFPRAQMGRFDSAALRSNLAFAGGMLWVAIVAGINTQLDKLLVSKLFSLTEFGYYTLASALAQVPAALATPIAVAFYPLVTAHVANNDRDQERLAFETYGQWIALIGALGAFGIALFAPEILALWLQDPDLPPMVAEISAVLAIGSLFLCLSTPSYYVMLAHGQSGLIALLVTGALLLSVPLTVVAVEMYGLLGAAFPWVITTLTNFIVVGIFVTRRHLAPSYFSSIIRTLLFPLVFALCFLFLARSIANILQLSPVLACTVAGIGAFCTGMVFFCAAQRRFPYKPFRNPGE